METERFFQMTVRSLRVVLAQGSDRSCLTARTPTLDLDTLGLLYSCSALESNFQDPILVAGLDLALVYAFGQGQAAAKRTVATLPYVVAPTLLLLLNLALPRDGQYP